MRALVPDSALIFTELAQCRTDQAAAPVCNRHHDQDFSGRGASAMSVSVAKIPKNRCRTTVAEPIGENASGTALYRGPSRSV